jgi:LSD1 subclass zinc finger protein
MEDFTYGQYVDRTASWYRDMVAQAEEAGTNLQDILGPDADDGTPAVPPSQQLQHVNGAESVTSEEPNSDEVLEQYRIMALSHAKQHLLRNTGHDLTQQEPSLKEPARIFPIQKPQRQRPSMSTGNKQKIQNPDQGGEGGSGGGENSSIPSTDTYDDLQLPLPRYNRKYLEKRTPILPVTFKGFFDPNFAGASSKEEEDHLVQCFGCRALLRVNKLATFVSCSECSSVSPVCRSQ